MSRVTEHETEKGVKFDFISLPAVSNTDAKAPNVTIPVGVHPWDVKSDYSFYSYFLREMELSIKYFETIESFNETKFNIYNINTILNYLYQIY